MAEAVGDGAPVPGEPGQGVPGRVTVVVHRYLVVGLLLALAVSPAVVVMVLLAPQPANVALAVLGCVVVGPALSAALFALERAGAEGAAPAAAFVRGYRLNAVDVLVLWVPALVALAVTSWTLVHLGAAGVPGWYAWLLVGVTVLVLLWLVHATVVASLFAFRRRDTARLAVYFLGRAPGATLGVLSVLVLVAAVAWWTSEAVPALFGVLGAALLLRVERPLVAEVRRRFVR